MENEKRLVIDVSEIRRHTKHFAETTLRNMKKDQLIEYIRILEHNINVTNSFLDQQARNFKILMKERCDKCLKESMGING